MKISNGTENAIVFFFFLVKLEKKRGDTIETLAIIGITIAIIGMTVATAALVILTLEMVQDLIERRKKWHTGKP